MQKIVPCLWFDDQAEEAARFYVSVFGEGGVTKVTHYDKASAEVSGKPEGSVLTVAYTLRGHEFLALNGGPAFEITPAISFTVCCKDAAEVDRLWERLIDGGKALMPIDKYDWSERYGWVSDRYGVSWQITISDSAQRIIPSLLFVGDFDKAEKAMEQYTSLFDDASHTVVARYPEGGVLYGEFALDGSKLIAMDAGREHKFTFSHGVSLIVNCEDQAEIDRLWESLGEGGSHEQCGWLVDRYGVVWQIVPKEIDDLLEGSEEAMKAMLRMKKLDVAKLRKAAGR